MTTSFFSLNQLPLPGLEDMTVTAQEAHTKWMWQLHIVRGLKSLENKTPLGPFLKVHLDSMEFLCGLALAQLDRRLGVSTSWEPASDAGGLLEITKAFIDEVPKARTAWNEWLGSRGPVKAASTHSKSPPVDAALGEYGGFGASAEESAGSLTSSTQLPPWLKKATEPKTMNERWMTLGAVAALGFIAYIVAR